MKKCVICDKFLTGNQRKFCSNACKQSEHWYKIKNQRNTYHNQTIRAYKRKLDLIKLSGGECQECGYKKNLSALQFHHRDCNTKNFPLDARTIANKDWNLILIEHNKCDLLCSNCHFEHHNPEMEWQNVEKIIGPLAQLVRAADS